MKVFISLVLGLFLISNLNAWIPKGNHKNASSGFGQCSFNRTEKDADGLFVFVDCGKKIGKEKCYVQKDVKGYQEIETGKIWEKLDPKGLTFIRDENRGRRTITKTDKKGRFEGYFTGDCKSFYTKEMAFDFYTGKYMKAKHDNIDIVFVDHPEVLGKWTFVDFVTKQKDFDATNKKWKDGCPSFKEIVFIKNGKTQKPYMTWTKEVLIHQEDRTASKYEIKNINDKDYLFIEHKSGDYVYRDKTPEYIVYERVIEKK